jgi:hypothetical protein
VKQDTSHHSLPSLGALALENRTITRKPMVEVATPGPVPRRNPSVLFVLGFLVVFAVGFAVALRALTPPPQPIPVAVVVPDAGPPAPIEVVAPPVEPPKIVDAGVVVKRPPMLKPRPPSLNVKSTPAGCALSLDGKNLGVTPKTFTAEPNAQHEVAINCAGYAPESRKIKAGPGEMVAIDFAPQPLGKGFLTLKTTPWSVIFEGERELGTTPLVKLELVAGVHNFRAVNSEQRLEKNFSVTIKPGETTARTLELNAP